jgi:hypothetical protein
MEVIGVVFTEFFFILLIAYLNWKAVAYEQLNLMDFFLAEHYFNIKLDVDLDVSKKCSHVFV